MTNGKPNKFDEIKEKIRNPNRPISAAEILLGNSERQRRTRYPRKHKPKFDARRSFRIGRRYRRQFLGDFGYNR
ncbi:hypothetical protein BK142_19290 [Paenibacillus glucanolyticus]|nr:hypothetical protein BK142_19290 [Paenibacillus glucanolyticus]